MRARAPRLINGEGCQFVSREDRVASYIRYTLSLVKMWSACQVSKFHVVECIYICIYILYGVVVRGSIEEEWKS